MKNYISRTSPLSAYPLPKKNGPDAFTLTELLVSITIVLIVVALAVPVANKFLQRAQGVRCAENIRQILISYQSYSADNNGDLPYNHYMGIYDGVPYLGTSQLWWHRELAPYLGFTWDEDNNWYATSKLPTVFRCPSDPFFGPASPTWKAEGSYGSNHRLTKSIPEVWPDGTPRTKMISVVRPAEMILIADTGHVPEDGDISLRIAYSQPGQSPKARHNGRGNVGWLDGHVTSETAARLTELHSEASPWPHWVP